MDFYLLILCIFSTVTVSIKGQTTARYDTCNTPNGLSGICAPLESCDSLYRITRKPSLFRSEVNFLRRSQCDNRENNGATWVCCPDEFLLTRPLTTQSTPTTTQATPTTTQATPTTTQLTPSTTKLTPPTLSSATQEITTTRIPSAISMMRSSAPAARISIRKCNEYKEFAYSTYYTYEVHSGVDVPKKRSNCAKSTVPTIVGGEEALPREFPHMALIGYFYEGKKVWLCGGTLISDQYVLSAAHCSDTTPSKIGKARYVRLGEHDLNQTNDATPIDFNIILRIVHPEYQRDSYYHDIALFKLNKAAIFNEAVRPVCLPEQPVVPAKAIATGWGRTTWNGTSSNVLLKAELDIFNYSQCSKSSIFNTVNRLNDQIQVCAGSPTKDTCKGDSGGPLQFDHENHHCTYTVYGITSYGPVVCGLTGDPGVYTRVYPYLKWIEDVVWPNE